MSQWFQLAAALAAFAGAGSALLVWRARKPLALPPVCCTPPPADEPDPSSAAGRLARLVAALDYLRTRREWRYRTPWILLLGAQGAGKSSLAGSVSEGLRHQPSKRELALGAEGAAFHFFKPGILIDPHGALPPAAPGSAPATAWAATLDQIDALRPERAIDGVLLAVSAGSLLGAGVDQVHALAENAFAQLRQVQARFEFALPVYVVVTGADAIPGFSAFWRTQALAGTGEIVGWSAPSQACNGAPGDAADSAFDAIGARLTLLQLEVAARATQIAPADADAFFLFPRHLQALRKPFRQWFATAFQPSAWQSGFFCRGIYFTGSLTAGDQSGEVRTDVRFVNDLVAKKVLAERGLARPTRAGIWSRNRAIRSAQLAGAALLVALLLPLAGALWQIRGQSEAMQGALALIRTIDAAGLPASGCLERGVVYQLANQLGAMDADAPTPLIPVSYLLPRGRRAPLLADRAVRAILLPALSCQLAREAEALIAGQPVAAGDYAGARQANLDYLAQVDKLEKNLNRYRTLTGKAGQGERGAPGQVFADLTEALYGSPLSAGARRPGSMLAAALGQAGASLHALDAELDRLARQAQPSDGDKALRVQLGQLRQRLAPNLPAEMQNRILARIGILNGELKKSFDEHRKGGPALVAGLAQQQGDLAADARKLAIWLAWMRDAWQTATPAASPCSDIEAELAGRYQLLTLHYQYPEPALKALSGRFDVPSCYAPAIAQLGSEQLGDYGAVFVSSGQGRVINPRLDAELAGLKALNALDFMQVAPAQDFRCLANVRRWRSAQLGEATAYIKEFDNFKLTRPAAAKPASGLAPLYERIGTQQLEQAINNSLLQAQWPQPAGPADPAILWASPDGTAAGEQQLAQDSMDFAAVLEPLIGLQRVYQQRQFARQQALKDCLRNFASTRLAGIQTLASASQLYQPAIGDGDGPFVDLGSTPVIKDYLARQVARSQVLTGYASPFLTYLNNGSAPAPAQQAATASAAYWNSSLTELGDYVQGKATNGAVAQLDKLFLQVLPGMSAANCGKTMAAYPSAAGGSDLFSLQRLHLEDSLKARCTHDRTAQANLDYDALFRRFNSTLAGKYPFADASVTDNAAPAELKSFFAQYDKARRDALRQQLKGLDKADSAERRAFLDQLDDVAAFFTGNLLTGDAAPAPGTEPPAPEPSQPLTLTAAFRTPPGKGDDQVLNWRLSSGNKAAGFPNRPATLEWPWGQALTLELEWASGSRVRPVTVRPSGDLSVEDATATFDASGDWALLRMIDTHRSPGAALAPNRIELAFTVPLTAAGTPPGQGAGGSATLYLTLALAGKNPKTQQLQDLRLPRRFPRFAP